MIWNLRYGSTRILVRFAAGQWSVERWVPGYGPGHSRGRHGADGWVPMPHISARTVETILATLTARAANDTAGPGVRYTTPSGVVSTYKWGAEAVCPGAVVVDCGSVAPDRRLEATMPTASPWHDAALAAWRGDRIAAAAILDAVHDGEISSREYVHSGPYFTASELRDAVPIT